MMRTICLIAKVCVLTSLAALSAHCTADDAAKPMAEPTLVFAEKDGMVAVEAEHFVRQDLTELRSFQITSSKSAPAIEPDGDPAHVGGAARGAYVEVLPDSRRNHSEKLIKGENFSDEPGKLAVLTYQVQFETPGRYYVWVRAFSSGSEDNGIHVGIDGTWPASGRKMQWCEGKKSWRWESKQRTEQEHCGEPHKIFLDVDEVGTHEIHFSMREDGFEFDRWLMTTNREFERPAGIGPKSLVHAGQLPNTFPFFKVASADVPLAQTQIPQPQISQPASTRPSIPLQLPRQANGDGSVKIAGELKQWHKVTLALDGPYAHELDNAPNPFTDLAFNVTFAHESGSPAYVVPGYFAADADSANSSAVSGTKWLAHLAPDKTGTWSYKLHFTQGNGVALDGNGQSLSPFDGLAGDFVIAASEKTGRDFRAKGRLQYVGKHHLQFAGSKEFFLKAGPDSPETLLGYADFDNTVAGKPGKVPLKTWQPHIQDWNAGNPTWRGGKGKGLIGGLNYLASVGLNSFSFMPYNAGGDGDNVWPFVEREDKLHYDCSKLDQWGIVFDHATQLGLHLHFKLQETEMDDQLNGPARKPGNVPTALDGGQLGPERKLYCRELIARFGHALALNWNIGEENTQTTDEVNAMVDYLRSIDPYQHHVVIHTFPNEQDRVYAALLGDQSRLTGVSLQNAWNDVHERTLQWVAESTEAGRPWVVANDEQGSADSGVPPDMGYQDYDGKKKDGKPAQTTDDIRKATLWGNLMAGGAGVEYYFGYQFPQNDLVCQDWRSREQSWVYCRIALDFFSANPIPFWEMKNANALIGNLENHNAKYCLAKSDALYLVYLADGGTTDIDLSAAQGMFTIQWFNPRTGGPLLDGSVPSIKAGASVSIGNPPHAPGQDWLVILRK